jgi:6-phosphofructokinase 2
MAAIVTLTMNPALDIATPAHKLRCTAPRYDAGGFNVARAVHALGGAVLAIFPAGGAAGEMIGHLPNEEGVAHQTVAITGFTRESLAVEERVSGKQYGFILPGPVVGPGDQERCLDLVSRAAAEAEFIIASGTLPLGVAPNFYAEVGAAAKRHRKRFVLDTSGAALAEAGEGIYLMKPSLRELAELTGREIQDKGDEEAAAQELQNWGIEQDRLSRVPGAHLRITTLRGAAGPGVELLQYLMPHDGRPIPADTMAGDLWAEKIVFRVRQVPRFSGIDRDPGGHAVGFASDARKVSR